MRYIKYIADRCSYNDDGTLVWVHLDRRKDRAGMKAGTLSSSDGYIYIKSLGKRVGAHRVVFFIHNGWCPVEIDHINRVRNDNRIENLRDSISHKNNMGNQSAQKGKSSRYKGVSWDKNRGKWISSIKRSKKSVFLGRFTLEMAAAKAYNTAALDYFGNFANLNEIAYEYMD